MEDTGCVGCYYAVPSIEKRKYPVLQCRRYPATYTGTRSGTFLRFPIAINKCGEFKESADVEKLSEALDQLFPKEQ